MKNTFEDDPYKMYIKSLGTSEVLSASEEMELGRLIANGDPKQKAEAIEKLVKANLKFVVFMAKKYSRKDNIADMIQEGNLGLLRAAEKFDYTKGFRFSTYAGWWVRQGMLRSYQNDRDNQVTASLDAPDERGNSLVGSVEDKRTVQPVNELDEKIQIQKVQGWVKSLPKREQDIIKMSYGFDGEEQPHEEIGKAIGITSPRVRQIKSKALRRLKIFAREPDLTQDPDKGL